MQNAHTAVVCLVLPALRGRKHRLLQRESGQGQNDLRFLVTTDGVDIFKSLLGQK